MKIPSISSQERNNPGLRRQRKIRRATRLIYWLPLSALTAASIIYLYDTGKLIYANLATIVATEAGSQLDRQVSLQRVFTPHLGIIEIDGLRVSNGPTFKASHGEAFLSASRVTINYDWKSLLFDSANSLHSVQRIDVYNAGGVIERRSDKSFNFTDIVSRPSTKVSKPFVGVLQVHGGTVLVRDFLAPVNPHNRPATNIFKDIYATVDARTESLVAFAGHAAGPAGRIGTVGAVGDVSRATPGTFRVQLTAQGADAPYWSRYAVLVPGLNVTRGIVSASAVLSHTGPFRTSQHLPNYFINAHVDNGALTYDKSHLVHVPATNVTGDATISPNSAFFTGSLLAGKTPVSGNAAIAGFKKPEITANVAFSGLLPSDIVRIVPSVKLPKGASAGPVNGTASIAGSLQDLTVDGRVSAPWASFQGNTVTNITASAIVRKNLVSVSSATFIGPGGAAASISGTVDAKHPLRSLSLAGHVNNINLAAFALPAKARSAHVAGMADVSFVTSQGRNGPVVSANVLVRNGHFLKTSISRVSGRVSLAADGSLIVRQLVVDDSKGAARISGTVALTGSTPHMNLTVDASNLALGRLANPYTVQDIDGIGNFSGALTGPLSAPQARGDVRLYNVRYKDLYVDAVAGEISVSRQRVGLSGIDIQKFPAGATLSGTVDNLSSRDPKLRLAMTLAKTDIQDLLSLSQSLAKTFNASKKVTSKVQSAIQSGLPSLSGLTTASLAVSGSLRNPYIEGQTRITNGTVGPVRIDEARANFALKNAVFYVNRGVVRAEGAIVTAHGNWNSKSGAISGVYAGDQIDLKRLGHLIRPYADVEGIVALSGGISGTAVDPDVDIGLVGRQLSVNAQHLAPITAFGSYRNGRFDLTGDPWQIIFTSPAGVTNGPSSVEYDINKLSFTTPVPSNGYAPASIDAAFAIPAKSPERIQHIIETLRSSYYATLPAGKALLASLGKLPPPIAGSIDIPSATVRGPLASPNVEATINGSGLAVGDTSADSVTASVASLSQDKRQTHVVIAASGLKVASIPLNRMDVDGRMSGTHFDLHTFRATSATAYLDATAHGDLNGDIAATVDASNVPLSLFDPLLPKNRFMSGTLNNLYIEASGRTQNPHLTASFGLDKPALAVRQPAGALSAAGSELYALDTVRSGTIELQPATPGHSRVVSISNLTAFKQTKNGKTNGLVPVAELSGSLPIGRNPQDLAALALDNAVGLHADLSVQDLAALAAFVPSIDPARTHGAVTASLGINSTGNLEGILNVNNASLGVNGASTSLIDINGNGKFVNGSLTIAALSAKASGGGTTQLTGHIDSLFNPLTNPTLSLQLSLNKFRIAEGGAQSLISRLYNTDIHGTVNGVVTAEGPLSAPKIATPAGAPLTITDAVGTIPTASPAAGTPGAAPTMDPSFDVHVTLGGKGQTVRVQNALMRADADGWVVIQGSLSDPSIHSRITVYRGQFIIPPSTLLKFTKPYGTVALDYPVPSPDPTVSEQPIMGKQVDLYAQSTVSIRPSVLASMSSAVSPGSFSGARTQNVLTNTLDTPVRYVIDVHIKGSLDQPDRLQMELTSNPGGLSQAQMQAALVQAGAYSGLLAGNLESTLKDQVSLAFNSIVLPSFIQPLEDNVQAALGLSAFSIDYLPDAPLHVTLTKSLANRLEVTYSRYIGARPPGTVSQLLVPAYSVSLGYNIAKRLQLSLSTDEQHNNTIAVQGVFGF